MFLEDDVKIINKAEKDAQLIVRDGFKPQQLELALRWTVSQERNIGLWDKYFDNLTTYELALEAYLISYFKKKMLNPEEYTDEKIDEMIESMKERGKTGDFIAPPGFEEMFK